MNVFLGIGVAWSIAAIYHAANGEQFKVSPGTLAFSVTLFTIFAFINVGVLLYRRRPEIGEETGICHVHPPADGIQLQEQTLY